MPPPSTPRYTCELIFHRATNIPIGDLNTLSSDPYLHATLSPIPPVTGSPEPPHSHKESISFRTATIRRTLDPVFDARWIVAGIPAFGFVLTLRCFTGMA